MPATTNQPTNQRPRPGNGTVAEAYAWAADARADAVRPPMVAVDYSKLRPCETVTVGIGLPYDAADLRVTHGSFSARAVNHAVTDAVAVWGYGHTLDGPLWSSWEGIAETAYRITITIPATDDMVTDAGIPWSTIGRCAIDQTLTALCDRWPGLRFTHFELHDGMMAEIDLRAGSTS
jgi:hypothetical protein